MRQSLGGILAERLQQSDMRAEERIWKALFRVLRHLRSGARYGMSPNVVGNAADAMGNRFLRPDFQAAMFEAIDVVEEEKINVSQRVYSVCTTALKNLERDLQDLRDLFLISYSLSLEGKLREAFEKHSEVEERYLKALQKYETCLQELEMEIHSPQGEGDKRMDITPFIPIIVEATKFIFNEVSRWISDVRRRADQQEDVPPVGSTLPVIKEQFSSIIEINSDNIIQLLNKSATQADIDEIRNLLEQLKKRRALFLELESQEITAAGAEAAKLRVNMQDVAREIIKTAERLESALARVYRSA